MSTPEEFIHYPYTERTPEEIQRRALEWYATCEQRRSVRNFSDRPVPRAIIETVIMTASTAPSGAHKQPWTFCAIADPHLKRDIRIAAEKEEWDNYHGRMTTEWLEDLGPLGTNWEKPFLEIAPWLIVVMKRLYETDHEGNKHKNYYVSESVGIATGMLIAAIHQAGLVTLTHTPSPMNFLQQILGRPENERPYLLMPVGYPAEGAMVPRLTRKSASSAIQWYVRDSGLIRLDQP